MKHAHESHWKATKKILQYIHAIVQFRILYSIGETPLLDGFKDYDWASDPDDQKYTTSYVFTLGPGPITWDCKKKNSIVPSSLELEYNAAVQPNKEAMWLRQILSKFFFEKKHPTPLWCDNQSSIQLCKDLVQHQWGKNIELHMHFIKNIINDHVLEVLYCPPED